MARERLDIAHLDGAQSELGEESGLIASKLPHQRTADGSQRAPQNLVAAQEALTHHQIPVVRAVERVRRREVQIRHYFQLVHSRWTDLGVALAEQRVGVGVVQELLHGFARGSPDCVRT